MSYIATINNQSYRVDTGENGRRNSVSLEGNAYPIDWRQVTALAADAKGNVSAGGHYSLLIGGRSYDIFARDITAPEQRGSRSYEIYIAGQRCEVTVEDERARLLAGLVRSGAHAGEAAVQAPMPGLVVNVPVEQGEAVTEGQAVVVLEAMKMENDLPAPIAGTIKEVRVSKGQAVDQGEVLVVIGKD